MFHNSRVNWNCHAIRVHYFNPSPLNFSTPMKFQCLTIATWRILIVSKGNFFLVVFFEKKKREKKVKPWYFKCIIFLLQWSLPRKNIKLVSASIVYYSLYNSCPSWGIQITELSFSLLNKMYTFFLTPVLNCMTVIQQESPPVFVFSPFGLIFTTMISFLGTCSN